jgi:hypothetical protein
MSAMHHNHPEETERDPVMKPASKKAPKNYPPKAVELLNRLLSVKADLTDSKALGLGWSDAEFVQGFKGFSPNLFYQLRTRTYNWPTQPTSASRLLSHLAALVEHAETWVRKAQDFDLRASQRHVSADFIEFPEFKEIKEVIKRCQGRVESRSEERLAVVVGESRSGKTWAFDKLLQDKVATWGVGATPAWKSSYFAMLRALYRVIFSKVCPHRSASAAEEAILSTLRGQSGVLMVTELQLIHPLSLAFLKTVLNETTVTVVLFMTPEYHSRLLLSDGPDRADRCQLLARCAGTVVFPKEDAAKVVAFAPELWRGCNPKSDPRLEVIAAEANRLGAKSLIRRVTDILKLQPESPPSLSTVETALKAFRLSVRVPNLTRRQIAV